MKTRFSVLLATEWFNPRLQMGVAHFARDAGWHISLEAIYRRDLPWGWQGDGCIAMATSNEMAEFLATLSVPVVDITHQQEALDVPRIHEDDEAIGQLAARHLLDLGFQNFAYYHTDQLNVSAGRIRGFQDTVREQGYLCTELFWERGQANRQAIWKNRRRWLVNQLKRMEQPTGIFCVDDTLAVSIVEVATDVGMSVPDQLAVVGVGNLQIASECSAIPITSIDLDYERMGYQAAAMLDALMSGAPLAESHIRFPPGAVIPRKSTETLATSDPLCAQAIRYMFDHFREDIGVEDIVRALELRGRRQLNYAMKGEFGTGPAGVLERIRLQEATRLLKIEHYTIERVAQEAGFGSALRFQRVFKRHFDTSPGRFRKEPANETL